VSSTPPHDGELAARFGEFGGRFVPETVIGALDELESAFLHYRDDAEFWSEFNDLLATYVGRPTPLTRAHRLGEHHGIERLYLKREDLCHTGAHKINNALGQMLLARRMGKERIIAETGAGQHGVATATAAALLGFDCVIYMGRTDMERQHLNVVRMRMLGAEVRPVDAGSATLKDATSEAIRDWVTNVDTTFYILGSAVGPHPYPMIVRDFQAVIGREVRRQLMEKEGRLPDILVACVGGGSNAIGLFHEFLHEPTRLVAVEAAGLGLESGKHAASLSRGRAGVLHGSRGFLLQDAYGQVLPAHSISAGLDYPGVGPELSYLRDSGRIECSAVTDGEALEAARRLTRLEGILPALESAHAVAHLEKLMPETPADALVVLGLSGRGDKDLATIASEGAGR
jgi:tryptophan synthase beta chain